jgi:hypothetical protein
MHQLSTALLKLHECPYPMSRWLGQGAAAFERTHSGLSCDVAAAPLALSLAIWTDPNPDPNPDPTRPDPTQSSQVAGRVAALHAALEGSLGLQPRARIGIIGSNSPEWMISLQVDVGRGQEEGLRSGGGVHRNQCT